MRCTASVRWVFILSVTVLGVFVAFWVAGYITVGTGTHGIWHRHERPFDVPSRLSTRSVAVQFPEPSAPTSRALARPPPSLASPLPFPFASPPASPPWQLVPNPVVALAVSCNRTSYRTAVVRPGVGRHEWVAQGPGGVGDIRMAVELMVAPRPVRLYDVTLRSLADCLRRMSVHPRNVGLIVLVTAEEMWDEVARTVANTTWMDDVGPGPVYLATRPDSLDFRLCPTCTEAWRGAYTRESLNGDFPKFRWASQIGMDRIFVGNLSHALMPGATVHMMLEDDVGFKSPEGLLRALQTTVKGSIVELRGFAQVVLFPGPEVHRRFLAFLQTRLPAFWDFQINYYARDFVVNRIQPFEGETVADHLGAESGTSTIVRYGDRPIAGQRR